ncbi:protein-S-isoprenylcysteine O-methyltransferase [Chelativorans sp. YIM 93263]|uniref:protein-S-isoprenylcysteine O-methyltransferase n=1 Tax=Chelativorans sp. YIM 93263 TaxID=2906648 RepID=UPI002379CB7F|nr:protein-S-isoprenylcysteine O-methyltransferase [Chelativorans sp. YIM 93263]
MSLASVGEAIWVLGIVAWYVIRYSFERRAKRARIVKDKNSLLDKVGLASALFGLAIFPVFYVISGIPEAADFPVHLWTVILGGGIFLSALVLFRITHKSLGKNWSITLQIREQHCLVRTGPYALVRHPMYTSFLLMVSGQFFLLANWFVGLLGLLGFAILFFLRVDKEEEMMLDKFGQQYRSYMGTSKRIIPFVY